MLQRQNARNHHCVIGHQHQLHYNAVTITVAVTSSSVTEKFTVTVTRNSRWEHQLARA
jgi:hypothetical protein